MDKFDIKNKYKKIYSVLWKEASYTYEKQVSDVPPNLNRLVSGFILESNDEFVKITSNAVIYENPREILLQDGFIIPRNAILDIKEIGTYE